MDRGESIEDLTSKVFKLIVEQGKEGILQSRLWKELNLTSRDGSRIAMRLEKRGLVTMRVCVLQMEVLAQIHVG
jgi:DNA-binding MarR family transcriptional regulator